MIGNTVAICHQIKQGEQEIPYPSQCPIRWMLRCMGASPRYCPKLASKQNVYANEDYLIIFAKWHFVYSRGFHFSWPNQHHWKLSAECANAIPWANLCFASSLCPSIHHHSFSFHIATITTFTVLNTRGDTLSTRTTGTRSEPTHPRTDCTLCFVIQERLQRMNHSHSMWMWFIVLLSRSERIK